MKAKIEVYEDLINLLINSHQRDPAKGYDKESFYYVEKAKARAFLDSLEEAKINVKAGLSSEIRDCLLVMYKENIKKLEKLLEKDLSGWLK